MIANYKIVKNYLLKGGKIKEKDWYFLNSGYKMLDEEDNEIATVRSDTFYKLYKELNLKIIAKTFSARYFSIN